MLADHAEKHWDLLVKNIASGDARIYVKPQFGDKELCGVGFHEAPRGTLSHRVVIKNGEIANYQAVVPTTWNAGPGMRTARTVPMRPRCSEIPLRTPSGRLKCGPFTCSILAWLVRIHTFDPEGKEVMSVS
jgi:hydrogenase large subunit